MDEYGNSFFKTVQEYFYERDDCIPGVHKTETKEWELYYICKCGEKSLRYAENALNIWLNTEQPQTSGKQLVTRSFLFGDLVGRKVVAGVSDYENGSLDIIFEGGIKLPTGNGETSMGEKLDFGEIHEIGVSQIDIIINNPGRAYGKFFFPVGLSLQWYKIFLYACAVSDKNWNKKSFSEVIERFVDFLDEYICLSEDVPAIVSKDKFIGAALCEIDDIRKWIKGSETVVVSKDMFHVLRSRYVFLPYVYKLIGCKNSVQNFFNRDILINLIRKSQEEKTNQKGVYWENVAEYVIGNISGLKISGKRVKTKYRETDLSVINNSLSEDLWQLGAFILTECKNWSRKVDIPVIRSLAYTTLTNGSSTVFLFAANGVTRDALEEIYRLTAQDVFVIVVTKEDVMHLNSSADCLNMIMDKFKYLKARVQNKF